MYSRIYYEGEQPDDYSAIMQYDELQNELVSRVA